MRLLVATALLLVALTVAIPALAGDAEPFVRECSTSQYGDLGRGWRERAVIAGPVAFVGMRDGYATGGPLPLKVLVVVDPQRVATATIAARSRGYAALGYNGVRPSGAGRIPVSRGTPSVRFQACDAVMSREPWNRGTQFGGYFLVRGRRCVHIVIKSRGKILPRVLRFGVPRCAPLRLSVGMMIGRAR